MKNKSIAALLALAALVLPASAKTYYVDAKTGSDANTGLKESLAFKTIQKAIDKAATGSTILVAPGTYGDSIDSKNKKLTVKAVDGPGTTTIDSSVELGKWGTQRYYASGHWVTRRTVRTGTSTTLSGFTIAGTVECGSLSHCVVSGNAYGSYDGPWGTMITKAKVSDSRIERCTGDTLVYNATLTRCAIFGNTVDYALVDLSTLCNCLVAGNNVGSCDLAIGTKTGYITKLYNTTIVDNTVASWSSGAGAVVGPNCDVYNCIIWRNRDTDWNPANIYFAADGKTGESVAFQFMGRYLRNGSKYRFYPASRTMKNTLVEDFLVSQKGNTKASGNLSGNPCFIDPAKGDYHLSPWSPCKDAGADYTKKTGKFDLDCGARKVGKVDMGAYELQPQTAVPADYDGDGVTDAAFYFAPSGQWWIFGSKVGLRTISLPDRNGVPCPADYDGDGKAEPSYFTAAAKTPEFVRVALDGTELERKAFGTKGATPVAVRFSTGKKATFGVYTANAKKPVFSFLGNPLTATFGAKASCPVVADFDNDKKDDIGVYTATASKPAFAILQSSQNYATTKLFNGEPVPLGAKGAIPCCADFDGIGGADFGVYLSNAKEPYFSRLFSSSQFRETRTLPMGSKGDIPVVGVYESGKPATPAVWTGTTWTYLKSDYSDGDLFGE